MAMADPCGASMEGSGADVEESELGAVVAAAVQVRDLVAAATGGGAPRRSVYEVQQRIRRPESDGSGDRCGDTRRGRRRDGIGVAIRQQNCLWWGRGGGRG